MIIKSRYYFASLLTVILLTVLIWANISDASSIRNSGSIKGRKIAIIIAYKNFEEQELNLTKDLLESEGANIIIVSSETGYAKGMAGTEIETDIILEELNVANFQQPFVGVQ